MFTGIVEEIGRVGQLRRSGQSARIQVQCHQVLEDLQLGGSLCVDGVCLSAVEIGRDHFRADVSEETLRRSTLGKLEPGASVNLERPMQPQGRLGGHIVNGHVDGLGRVTGIPPGSAGPGEWTFSLPESLGRYVVEKGSIAIDGISLTVAGIQSGALTVAIIPATVRQTTLQYKKVGDRVNLEVDILAKYVEKMLNLGQISASKNSDLEGSLKRFEYL